MSKPFFTISNKTEDFIRNPTQLLGLP